MRRNLSKSINIFNSNVMRKKKKINLSIWEQTPISGHGEKAMTNVNIQNLHTYTHKDRKVLT